MNLKGCQCCGVVINLDIFNLKDEEFYDEEGFIMFETAEWENDLWYAVVKCPVCKNKVVTNKRL